MGVWIDRCYCANKSFVELLHVARARGLDLTQLAAQESVGTDCGWCVAYLRRMLATGETRFDAVLPKEPLVFPAETDE